MGIDASGLQALAAQLAAAAQAIDAQGRAVVSKGALNIKTDWRANATRSAGTHGRLYPSSIGYDLAPLPGGGTGAVIGPDKEAPQGPLGNLIEFGSVNNPPHNDGGRALAAEEPRFIAAAETLGGELL
ncbi:hypothetical protein [Kitasatospora sp. HPMI-4]|uniref:hypothetical protein n=1 Tax=Kitasatospora sp. HPMI-4 TaxID=3448443 RepID=UPI003F1B8375